ncbi:ArsR family transcriptional regulator [Paenibacillus doosanensis]|uniref:Bacterial regulatory protein, arsR family n=1 Tax=Paenibacillus konkukensis TaxID=2020716 RepID=A0ABY4REY7_9BACL|nr:MULTISPECIES: ArsR family transcriptional regulator [Paenibacillus]MCS7463857.1 ArsR family transcriptional regulator [Paenibacillus doosanensis]UQZ81166.1 Bacterial regulatory protein, arsR family [Paenibacillus konkukensis]
MKLDVTTNNMKVLECFSSETRVRIIELLNGKPYNIGELAEALGLSSAIITKHIQKLEEAGIVSTENTVGKRGTQKLCSLHVDQLVLVLRTAAADKPADHGGFTVELPVGQYIRYEVHPTCGLASFDKRIGMMDDPRYFDDPEHTQAEHLWFGSGFVEYRIPNYLVGQAEASSIAISLEICSEAPHYNENWPSDITFSINDTAVATWTCPGDFGSKRGLYTPPWWNDTQYGLHKTVSVTKEGTHVDGVRFSDVQIGQLNVKAGQELRFRIACPASAANCGGVSLFGKRFGNYPQDIRVTVTV